MENTPIFRLDRIYIKDLSLELPYAPGIFLSQGKSYIDMNLDVRHADLGNDLYETTLLAKISAKTEDKQLFLLEIEQSGIFCIKGILEDQLDILRNVECPHILFPYLREAVSDLTIKAGVPPLILSPVNFASLHQQKQQAMSEASTSTIN